VFTERECYNKKIAINCEQWELETLAVYFEQQPHLHMLPSFCYKIPENGSLFQQNVWRLAIFVG
jgi:hypothetical protein